MENTEQDICSRCGGPAFVFCFQCELWFCDKHVKKDRCKYEKTSDDTDVVEEQEVVEHQNEEETSELSQEDQRQTQDIS